MNANQFASPFQFCGSTITKLEINNELKSLDSSSGTFKRTLDLNYFVQDIQKDDEEDLIYGLIELHISFTVMRKEDKRKMKAKLHIEGLFSAPSDVTEEKFNEYLRLNGSAILYSNARAILASVTSQSVLSGSVILPVMNLVHFMEHKKKIENEKQ